MNRVAAGSCNSSCSRRIDFDNSSSSAPKYGTQGTTLVQDFVQEVDVKTGGFQAEYGRSSGGVLNVVTKSGGNEFHGSIFGNYTPFEASRNSFASFSYIVLPSPRARA